MLAPVSVYCADALCRIYIANTRSQFHCKPPHISHKMEVFTSHCAMARQAAVGVYMLPHSVTSRLVAEQASKSGPGRAVVPNCTALGHSGSSSLTKNRARDAGEKRKQAEAREAKKALSAQKAAGLKQGPGSIGKPKRSYKCKRCGLPKAGHTCLFGGGLVHERTDGVTPRGPDNGFGGSDAPSLAVNV